MRNRRIERLIEYLVIGAAILLVAGCADRLEPMAASAIDEAKQFNDLEAQTIRTATCAIRLGSFYRIFSSGEQEALRYLCEQSQGRPAIPAD